MTHDSEFGAWLDAATRGLPETPARTARLELATHYTDALADHLEHGIDALEARRLALAGLGAPGDVARGLLDTHVGRGQYLLAAGLCLWNLLMQPVVHYTLTAESPPPIEAMLIFAALFAVFFPTMYILEVGRMLFEWRLRVPHARLMIGLTMAGVAFTTVIVMLSEVLFYTTGSLGVLNRIGTPVTLFALALTGVGLLWLAATCARFASGLHGLGRIVAVLVGLMGVGQFALAAGALTTASGGSEGFRWGYWLISAAHVVLWPALMLMFYRLVYRKDFRSMLPA